MAPDFSGVEVEENIRGHHHDAVARRVIVAVTKDRLPDLTLDDIVFDFL
jgi:hypothetical protein